MSSRVITLLILVVICPMLLANQQLQEQFSNIIENVFNGSMLDFGKENPYRAFNVMINNIFFRIMHLENVEALLKEKLAGEASKCRNYIFDMYDSCLI